jgi:Sulfotransferase domain
LKADTPAGEMKNEANFSAHRFLIIAGTSKAGTTSVFNYLAAHPQICPAEKETRFFLNTDYPLPSKKRYQNTGPETYLSLFDSGPQENWRLEATPDYLYSANTPHFMRQTLPNVRLIFILREPISRLLSWYRFARKRSVIPSDMTFDDYVRVQQDGSSGRLAERRHPAFFALEHGRYSIYLQPYLDLFGESSVRISFYEDLRRGALAFTLSICRWLDIDETYFRDFRFDVVNKSSDVHSRFFHKAYLKSTGRARHFLRDTPKLRLLLRRIRPGVHAIYEKMNVTEGKELTMSATTKEFLLSYYRDESTRLREMLGVEIPWLSNSETVFPGVQVNSSGDQEH